MNTHPTDCPTHWPDDLAHFAALLDLSRLAEIADRKGNERGANLYRLAHQLAAIAASPVIANPSPEEAAAIVDALDAVAGDAFAVSTNVEHGQ